ncbi:uncharacterized protein SPPG_06594 [Spizellomyces punctatus DAOM BR117]|uniref:Uncharacterized protein n=1 Tax=Spizellomyces punctatus (strain DAOM BR117) TaxID=645134 RepID=A0A0L0HAK4_SPIPD|nr:uncharacterized protein SPPG_06594 [Spizellomyces punctatus DAOM BR117]KNC98192.1 hypothetical protein SPPG_06594 [Spizellomyces punctatus DAOM BR117]|eukprot:XP_016606232.1 hypothetical protein SPPG_06594 [Spizellomyces punctatus DAOM BR117]
MWKRKEIAVNSSSVVDLKAELFRKKEEFEREKLRTGSSTLRAVSNKPIKKPPKNKGVEQRARQDEEEIQTLSSTLESSWVALQRKAKLYDKLVDEGGTGEDEKDEEALVDFLQKSLTDSDLPAPSPDIEDVGEDTWVEAVDEFGRTRIVRKDDVSKLGLRFIKEGEAGGNGENEQGPSLVSDDMRREMEREQWEKEAREALASGHYDSRRENRTMGVGFYQFSQDDEERRKQMEELKDMRNETLESRTRAARMKDARKDKLDERKRLLKERAAKRRKVINGESEGAGALAGDNDGSEKGDGDELRDVVSDFLQGIRKQLE